MRNDCSFKNGSLTCNKWSAALKSSWEGIHINNLSIPTTIGKNNNVNTGINIIIFSITLLITVLHVAEKPWWTSVKNIPPSKIDNQKKYEVRYEK